MLKKLLLVALVVCLAGCNTPTSGTTTASATVQAIVSPPPIQVPAFQMSQIAEDMVTDSEVSSNSVEGHSYYDKIYKTATFAGEGSGATIAVGVDLAMNSSEWTTTSWSPFFPNSIVSRFAACSGDTSVSAAKRDVANLQDIVIVWNIALSEFDSEEVPNYYSTALRVFPGLSDLTINAQSGVLSTAYNRGFSMVGSTRSDMRNLRTAVANKDYQGMANACLHMHVTMGNAWRSEGTYAGLTARYKATAALILTPDS